MEHARENNNEVWIILQDMKRAFDSVDPLALEMALRRIKVPEPYIRLYKHINDTRANCVTQLTESLTNTIQNQDSTKEELNAPSTGEFFTILY